MTNNPKAIALLAILYLPVFNSLDNSNLARGADTMKPNQILGRGSYALEGHYMTNTANLFLPLKRVQNSAYVYLAENQQAYTYQIINKRLMNTKFL